MDTRHVRLLLHCVSCDLQLLLYDGISETASVTMYFSMVTN